MAVPLADRQHFGNDQNRMSQRKIILSFGIIYATFFRNKGNTPKWSLPHTCQDRVADAGRQKFGIPKNCTLTEGNKSEKLLKTLIAVKQGAQDWGFHSKSHYQTTSGLPEIWNRRFHTKSRALLRLPSLMWQVECFRVFLVRSLCDSLAAP